jgi:hypothetical protein
MMKKMLFVLTLLFALSCKKDDSDSSVKQNIGNVWLSGGLAFCAQQIHLDNGDTLIVRIEDVISFTSGDRVTVKYKVTGTNESCPPGKDCEIIEIKKAE